MTLNIKQSIDDTTASFDYASDAELFSSEFSRRRSQALVYRRFISAAEAIRFAIEDLPARFLLGTYLEVGESRLPSAEFRRLYASPHYPLTRKSAGGVA